MKLTVLGSGTMTSPPKRTPAGYLLEHNDDYLLVDMGPGIIRQLKCMEIDLLQINNIAISHFHLDHCSDLMAFLMNRFLLQENANQDLTIFGPTGLEAWFSAQAQWQGAWLHNARPRLIAFDHQPVQLGSWQIIAALNGHTDNSMSLRIANGATLFYSSDTGFQEELVPLARDVDLAIIECSLPDHLKIAGHLTPSDVARFSNLAKLQRILATHIYPQNDTPDLKQRIQRHFAGEVIIASDFLTLYL
ncbi:MBL fold metallo-hydrolase [Caldithrix abyssi]